MDDPLEGGALGPTVERAELVACVEGGLEVGGASLEAFASEAVGSDLPSAPSNGVGEVLFYDGVLGNVDAEVCGAEVEGVRGVGP